MEIKIQVSADDLMNIRFAYSPLIELITSYYVLNRPPLHAPYRQWVDEAQRAIHDIELPYLSALLEGKRHYIPDFLTPTPLTTQHDLESELQTMLSLPKEVIRANLESLIADSGDSEMRQYFMTYPQEMIVCLVDELRLYWQRTLAHHWQRLTSILDGDILYRARSLALHGPVDVLNTLHPKVRYESGQITIAKAYKKGCLQNCSLRGDGLQLVPTLFANEGFWWQIVPEWHPMLLYHARGMGLWRQTAPTSNESLEIALGAGRARVLQSLATPLNTGEIARQLEITSAAVSQHLGRLQEAGL
ncbi:MAG: helix-turn-helix domain-containing protein, partial [Anaerolineae bacterium]|nr:helix-turn-helix domain-containing protein [Anaerolineae bacterium]